MQELNGMTHFRELASSHLLVVVYFYSEREGSSEQMKSMCEQEQHNYDPTVVTFCQCDINRHADCASLMIQRRLPNMSVFLRGTPSAFVILPSVEILRRNILQFLSPNSHAGEHRVQPPNPDGSQGGSQPAGPPANQHPTPQSNPQAQASSNELSSEAVYKKVLARVSDLARAVDAARVCASDSKAACEALCVALDEAAETQPFGTALLPYFASDSFHPRVIDALFDYLSNQSSSRQSDPAVIVNELLRYLLEFFLIITWGQVQRLQKLRQAVVSLISCTSSILPIMVESPFFRSDYLVDGVSVECHTLLGAMIGVGPQPRILRTYPPRSRMAYWDDLVKFFPEEALDTDTKKKEIQVLMETACAANLPIIRSLLQSTVSRDPTLRWVSSVLKCNSGYAKTMHDNLPLSSRYLMAQLNDVLVAMTLPIFTKGFDPSSVATSYVLGGRSQSTMVDFGDDVERITHFDENHPLPLFTEPETPYRPTAHFFFLTIQSTMLGVESLIEDYERDSRDLTHPRVPPNQRKLFFAEKCMVEGLLGSVSLGRNRMEFLNGVAGWLVRIMRPTEDGKLPDEPPEEWKYLPQRLVDAVIRCMQLAPLDAYCNGNITSLMLLLMGNTDYFPKPHTHALFPSYLEQLMGTEYTKRAVMAHPWFAKNIIRSCLKCYIAVEKSTYEKVSVRYTLSHCIKEFLQFDSLCEPVRAEFEVDGTLLERFSHMVTADVNEAVDQLIETLTTMNRMIKEGADLSENARPQGQERNAQRRASHENEEEADDDEEEDGENNGDSPLTYHQLGLGLRQYILLFQSSMELFIQLSISFSRGVTQNMVTQQISQMLARSLTSFAGSESKNLKIEHPERYNFRPRKILTLLVDCLTQFRRFQNFLRCLCNCGVPLKDLLQAMRLVIERELVGESLAWKLREMASTLEALSTEVDENEALWDEAPEYALDALLSTPLTHPVALPAEVKDVADLVYVNEDTIHHVLLSESKHPFTKEYLDEKMVKDFNAREEVTKAREELKSRVATWLNEAKSKRNAKTE